MVMVFKVHPSIGVARVGNSREYYLAPETTGGLPLLPDGREFRPSDFRDGHGAIRRQAARFRVYRYDADHPEGVEVVPGRDGVRALRWTVHLANKKGAWYQFLTLLGEHGYSPDHPLRNAGVTEPDARRRLMIDAGPRTLDGPGQHRSFSRTDAQPDYPAIWPPEGLKPDPIDTLGDAYVDDAGRLIVAGGLGCAGSSRPPVITHYVNNDDWWDDTSDGPVRACVVFDDGREVEVQFPAWVLVGPPKFAPEAVNLVTLWDTMYDAAVRHLGHRPDIYSQQTWQSSYTPCFDAEIAPILRRGMMYPWLTPIPPHAHHFHMGKLGDPDPKFNALRGFILQVMRPPSGPDLLIGPTGGALDQVNAAPGLTMMPYLAGDNAFHFGAPTSKFLKLTDTQYFLLQQWARGQFHAGGRAQTEPAGAALDRAALDNCVGGGFSPGMEITWISRNPALYMEPLRFRHKPDIRPPLSLTGDPAAGLEPGDATRHLAVPWQADYNECSSEDVDVQLGPDSSSVSTRYMWWWPAQRPAAVWRRDPTSPLGRRQEAWVGSLADQTADDYAQFADDLEMVTEWKHLRFLFNYGTAERPELMVVEDAPDGEAG